MWAWSRATPRRQLTSLDAERPRVAGNDMVPDRLPVCCTSVQHHAALSQSSDTGRSRAAVHVEGLAGAEARCVAREEEHAVADLLRVTEPALCVHEPDGLRVEP